MFNDDIVLEQLKNVLVKIKLEFLNYEVQDDELFQQALDALALIGEKKIYELKEEVYQLVNFWEPIIRGEAVATLGYKNRLYLQGFRDEAYKIWKNDPDETVRGIALGAWTDLLRNTKNKHVIKELYSTLKNNNETGYVRLAALSGIFLVSNEPSDSYDTWIIGSKYIDSETPEEFNSLVDWEDVHKVIRKYAPEIMQH